MSTNLLWPDLSGKRVLLGISGGIAAYKAAQLCRLLVRCGAEVRVMMTSAAQQFVGPTTLAALSGKPVATDLFDPAQEDQIGHIDLADWADLLLLAPATANLLAKLNHGVADDLVSTVYLACTAPVLLAPAMNVHMWEHAATRGNVQALVQRGHKLVGPDSGQMACGHVGAGRMAEPEQILEAAGACVSANDLLGHAVLVSAGPTHEPVDPVRFVGNRSSGKMGFALAAEAASRGAQVTLVSGPVALPTPLGVQRVQVTTAAEMAEAVRLAAPAQAAVIMAAAVADYRPEQGAPHKLKKEAVGAQLTLTLERTDDILATLAHLSPRPYLVGFAAETEELDRVAPAKLAAKGCDLLVANDVSATDAGFETDENRAVIYDPDGGRQEVPLQSKRMVAARILDRVVAALERQQGE